MTYKQLHATVELSEGVNYVLIGFNINTKVIVDREGRAKQIARNLMPTHSPAMKV